MTDKIVWKDLDKRTGLFTKRNATMVDLSNGAVVQYYSTNTKINVVQETIIDGIKYFRTETAAGQSLDWAFKAFDFDLPNELASLGPSKDYLNESSYDKKTHSENKTKILPKKQESSKSEEGISEDRKWSLASAFKRFFRKSK